MMFFSGFLKNHLNPFSMKKGNSLTFLLGSMSIISLSLTITTMMVGSSLENNNNTSKISSTVNSVAEHHLDRIERCIKETPEFMDYANLRSGSYDTASGDKIPPFRKVLSTFLNTQSSSVSTPCTGILSYTETINVNGNSVNVTSSLPGAESNMPYGVIRFDKAPYENQFMLTVKTSGGTTNMTRSRIVPIEPETCRVDKSKPVQTWTIAGSTDYRLNTLTDSFGKQYFIRPSEPFIQVGPTRICKLPEKDNTALNGTLDCMAEVSAGLYYLAGGEEARVSGYSSRYLFYYNNATQSLKLKIWNETSSNLNYQYSSMSSLTSAWESTVNLPNLSTMPEAMLIKVFPLNDDANKNFVAAIVYKNSSDNRLYLTWARWDNAGIKTEGVFATTFTTIDIFQSEISGDVQSWTFDPATNLIVGTGKNGLSKRVVVVKKLTSPDISNTTLDSSDLTNIRTSTIPTATNEADFLLNPTNATWGKPAVSKDGKFVVMPVSNGSSVDILAFNLSDKVIDYKNYPVIAASSSNTVSLVNIGSTASLGSIYLWYNDDNNRFYWLANNDTKLYEWDPKLWGVGPSTGLASDWMESYTSSPEVAKKNISIIGSPGTSASLYTGNYSTVRMIGPAPYITSHVLWSGSPYTPQLIYDKNSHKYWIWDQNAPKLTRIDLEKGYLPAISGSSSTSNKGQIITMDPKNNKILYMANNQLIAFDTETSKSTNLSPSPAPTLNDSNNGDGDIFYSTQNNALYYLDTTATSAELKSYRPYCPSKNDRKNQVGNIPGFGSINHAKVSYRSGLVYSLGMPATNPD